MCALVLWLFVSFVMADIAFVLPQNLKGHLGREYASSTTCFHLNVQSAKNKTDDLEMLFDQFDFSFDVIMLSETWYTDEVNVLKLPLYRSFCVNRTSRRGGGLSILTKDYQCELVSDYSRITPDYEVLCIRNNSKIFVVMYRPPKGNLEVFFDFFESFLEFVNEEKCTVVCGGDFNIDMTVDTVAKKTFDLLISSGGCTNVVTRPTRVTCQSQTLIDLFISNCSSECMKAGVIGCDLSDHLPIFIAVKSIPRGISKTQRTMIQKISPDQLDRFRSAVSNVNWSGVLQEDTADGAYNAFMELFVELYNRYFPFKSIKISKRIRKPWVTHDLLCKIRIKNSLFSQFAKSRDLNDLKRFKIYRNILNKELKRARERYYSDVFTAAQGRTDIMWRQLNSLLNRKRPSSSPEKIVNNGIELSGCSLANAFNEHFINVTATVDILNSSAFTDTRNNDSIFLEPVVEPEVRSVLLQLKNSASCDADGIQVRPVKYVVDMIAPALSHIFNLCLATSVFPKRMQIAKVLALHKEGSVNELGNYRPISILPVLSKVLEKVLYNRLMKFSNKYNIINTSQYGFMKHKSTETALLDAKELISQNFEEKKLVLGLFIDFSKAFDCLNHQILLTKLDTYGFRGHALRLLKSYLEHRSQYVFMNGYSSLAKPILSGVPQGSILGPFLFNIYVNDIINIYSEAKFVNYADDTSIFFSGENADVLIDKANVMLGRLNMWSRSNLLQINVGKSEAVLFRPKNKVISITKDLTINSTKIEIVNSFKILGIIFTNNMSWDNHINYLNTKLSQIVGMLNRHRHIVPMSVKLMIYNSLFYSHLNYCHLVWGTTTPTNLDKILLLQKKAVRAIGNMPFQSHTSDLFKKTRCHPHTQFV